ncbi:MULTISPECIES: glycoside hydrolase family 43 protein [unclassified Knoellia]|uniref:glycoside hydrolase family 43 protein n=1 Tax=Knoellia altitudinis TaxID=3404795 RepID=UPI0036239061
MLLLAGCQDGGVPDAAPTQQTTEGGTGLTNPVWRSNFPDPQIVKDEDGYVAFATNGNGMNVQTLTSTDLVEWSQGSDALPELPAWTFPGKVWAPEAARFGDSWVMYYTTRAPNPEIQCIGVAVADEPEGPYLDNRPGPLVCEADRGGSIDASPFVAADGKAYLYWKNDGNAVGVDTWISVQPLSPDGTGLVGKPRRLLKQDLAWEGELVEAPSLMERDGTFHLFYSANDFGSDRYAVGHATSSSPLGPFVKTPEPVLVSTEAAAGPGHCSLVEKDGKVWMVYHAWAPDAVGSEVPGRTMWLSEVTFDGKSVRVEPPATTGARRP